MMKLVRLGGEMGRTMKIFLAIVVLFLIFSFEASAANTEDNIDFATSCYNHFSPNSFDELKDILENPTNYALDLGDKWLICFYLENPIRLDKEDEVIISNDTQNPLVIFGLNLTKIKTEDGKPTVIIEDGNVILQHIKINNESCNIRDGIECSGIGIKVLSSWNVIANAEIDNFYIGLIVGGMGNVVMDSKVTASLGADVSGDLNRIENVEMINPWKCNRFIGGIKLEGSRHRVVGSKIQGYDIGVDVNCSWDNLIKPLDESLCVIGPDNSIVDSRYAVYVQPDSPNITITKNSIPYDQNWQQIYYEQDETFGVDLFDIDNVGIVSDSLDFRGGYHIVGKLNKSRGMDLDNDVVEMFLSDREENAFITECDVKRYYGKGLSLAKLDSDGGKVPIVINYGDFIFDCGDVDISEEDIFSFTYVDSVGNTYIYSQPMSIGVDTSELPHGRYVALGIAVVPNTTSGVKEVLQDFQSYALEEDNRWLLCFRDENVYRDNPPFYIIDSDIVVNNDTDKDLLIYGLNVRKVANYASDEDIQADVNTPYLRLTGNNIKLVKAQIKYGGDNKENLTGIRVEGHGHEILHSKIEGFDHCIDATGYKNRIKDSEMSWCNIGVHASCHWPDYLSNDYESSCVIGPGNYFENIWGDAVLYVTSEGQQVTFIQNKLKTYKIFGPLIYLEPGANNDIESIDTNYIGTKIDMKPYGSPIIGKLNSYICDGNYFIEMYYVVSIVSVGSICEIGYLEDSQLVIGTTDSEGYLGWGDVIMLSQGDCIFECNPILGYDGWLILTDPSGNTSSLSDMIKSEMAGGVIAVSSPSPSIPNSETEFSENNDNISTDNNSEEGDYEGDDDSVIMSDTGEDDSQFDREPLSSLRSNVLGVGCQLNKSASSMNISLFVFLVVLVSLITSNRKYLCRS